jgi:hypothetical protein
MSFFLTEMPNFPFVQLGGLAIIHPKNALFHIEMDCAIATLLSVHTVDFLSRLWEEVILEYVGPRVPRHATFSARCVLKPRAEGFFAIGAQPILWRCRAER